MGFWNDGVSTSPPRRTSSHRTQRSRSSSRERDRQRSSSSRHYSSKPSYSRSASSFFSLGSGYGSSSSRGYGGSSSRARSRPGLINKIRKWLKDLYYYMRKHPVKVFVLVIMPLLTGGALTKILSTFGVRLPRGLESMIGGAGARTGERFYSRGGARDFGGGSALPGMGGGLGESIQGAMSIAKMFM